MLNEQMDRGLRSGVARCLEPLVAAGLPPPTPAAYRQAPLSRELVRWLVPGSPEPSAFCQQRDPLATSLPTRPPPVAPLPAVCITRLLSRTFLAFPAFTARPLSSPPPHSCSSHG